MSVTLYKDTDANPVCHTVPTFATAFAVSLDAPATRSVSGYGRKLPTRYTVQYRGRWRRVYVMNYGNAGSAYILVNGRETFLDTATEYALSDGVTPDHMKDNATRERETAAVVARETERRGAAAVYARLAMAATTETLERAAVSFGPSSTPGSRAAANRELSRRGF